MKIHITAFPIVPMYVYLKNRFSSLKLFKPTANPQAETMRETKTISPT